MPVQISGLKIMDEDRVIREVLDKFVNCHEQTYEEFLGTFTYLSKGIRSWLSQNCPHPQSKEDKVTERGASGADSSENIFTSMKFTHENEQNDHPRNKTLFIQSTSEEEQIVLDEGQKVGTFIQGDLNRAGKMKVDNFLDLEDLEMDEEIKPQMSNDLLLLPGEVEQDISTSVPSYVPSVARPSAPGVKPRFAVKRVNKQMEEIPGDEIQPFILDEEFDYDSVMLTPKFTPAEIHAIKDLTKQNRRSTNTGLEEPGD